MLMAAPNNRQMNALPKDGKHRHLRPQITGYTSKLGKVGDTSAAQKQFGPVWGHNAAGRATAIQAQQYRKDTQIYVSLEAMELARWRASTQNTTLTRYGGDGAELRAS